MRFSKYYAPYRSLDIFSYGLEPTMFHNKFNEIMDQYTEHIRNVVGKCKRTLPLYFEFNGENFEISYNYTNDSYRTIFVEMLKEAYSKFHKYGNYHDCTTLSRDIETNDLFNRIDKIIFNGEKIVFIIGNEVQKYAEEHLINDVIEIINYVTGFKEHIKEIKEDFTNYMNKEENILDLSGIKLWIDFVQENKDVLKLDKYTKIKLNLNEGYTQLPIENISEIESFITRWANRETDIIGIVPDVENWNVDNFYNTNVLSFSFIYNDNHYAVQKYLNRVKSEGISAYYASKQSGDYVGD